VHLLQHQQRLSLQLLQHLLLRRKLSLLLQLATR
jgi:hypothetical protein